MDAHDDRPASPTTSGVGPGRSPVHEIGRFRSAAPARPMTRSKTKGRRAWGGPPLLVGGGGALKTRPSSVQPPLLTVRPVQAKNKKKGSGCLPGPCRPPPLTGSPVRMSQRDSTVVATETRTRKGRRPTHRPSRSGTRTGWALPGLPGTTHASSVEFPRSADRHLRLKAGRAPKGPRLGRCLGREL
jgi:hypothetical protein